MPVVTLNCGCTLDSDFVSTDHLADGPPFHIVLKPNAKEAVVTAPPVDAPEAEAEDDGKGKKKRW